jgi:hypothetical protein
VSYWLVGKGEFSKEIANHVRLDFHGNESLSAIDVCDSAHHFWSNNAVSEMSLHSLGLLALNACGNSL